MIPEYWYKLNDTQCYYSFRNILSQLLIIVSNKIISLRMSNMTLVAWCIRVGAKTVAKLHDVILLMFAYFEILKKRKKLKKYISYQSSKWILNKCIQEIPLSRAIGSAVSSECDHDVDIHATTDKLLPPLCTYQLWTFLKSNIDVGDTLHVRKESGFTSEIMHDVV